MFEPYRQFRSFVLINLVWLTKPLVGLLYKPKRWNYGLSDLRQLPPGTLGHAIADTLTRHGFQLLPHYEAHDAKHLLLDYPMTGEGEARMQFFLLGNGNHFVSVWATVVLAIILMPDQWLVFRRDYQRGAAIAANVSAFAFDTLLTENLCALRARLSTFPHAPSP